MSHTLVLEIDEHEKGNLLTIIKKKITGKESGERKLSGGQISTTSNYDLDICWYNFKKRTQYKWFLSLIMSKTVGQGTTIFYLI